MKVAFAAGFMAGFSDCGLKQFADYRKPLEAMSEELGFELLTSPEPVQSMQQAQKLRREWDQQGVDFVLFFHPSYIIGDQVFELMKTKAQFGLWAIEEPTGSGPMPLASFVNLVQNASIASHNFVGRDRKMKWFYGGIESKYFKPRFEITIRALTAVKRLRDARVAQIGKVADGHINHYNDKRQIYRHLGVDVSRDFEIEDVIARSEQVPESLVQEELDKLRSCCKAKRISEGKIVDSVKMYLAVREIAQEHDYSAVAFSCQNKLMPLKQMTGCLVNALLNNTGIVASCEGDVLSAVSMLVLKSLSGQSTSVMDMSTFDESDESLQLWHCGTAPFDMADCDGVTCNRHYFADYLTEEKMKDTGPVTEMVFKAGDATAFRFTKEGDYFYYFTGKMSGENKPSWDGSRGWVQGLKLYGKPIKVIDLVDTILTNGLAHHFPLVLKDVGKYIEEFAYWLDLKKIERREYKDFLYV